MSDDEKARIAKEFYEREETRLQEVFQRDGGHIRNLARWSRHDIWGNLAAQPRLNPAVGNDDCVARLEATLSYMIRRLSKGMIPHVETVTGLLEGSVEIPECGFVGCYMKEEHVH